MHNLVMKCYKSKLFQKHWHDDDKSNLKSSPVLLRKVMITLKWRHIGDIIISDWSLIIAGFLSCIFNFQQ